MNKTIRMLAAVVTAALVGLGPGMAMAQGHAGHGAAAPADGHRTPPAFPVGPASPPSPSGHDDHGVPAQPPADAHAGHETPAAPAAIALPADVLHQAGVRTVAATRQPLVKTIRAAGRVQIDERRIAAVTTKVEGWIEALHADHTGRPVKRGEILAEIYSPQIMATQLEYLRLKTWQKRPSSTIHGGHASEQEPARMLANDVNDLLAAATERLRLLDAGIGFIDRLEREGQVQRTIPVISPIDGVVTAKMALAGGRVMAGETLFELADLSRVWVIADVFEYELFLVNVGTKARLHIGEQTIHGASVDYIYPEITDQTRTARVRFSVPNPKTRLLPRMYVNVAIELALGNRIAVPLDALIDTGQRQIVYVETGPGRFEMQEVFAGVDTGRMIEIREGLAEGQKVAAAAAFLIDAETRLRGGAGGAGHSH